MEPTYGAPTDIMPYLLMAYGIGFTLLFGYGIYLFLQAGKLKQMRDALNQHQK